MTVKNWTEYTDFELNCLVAEAQGYEYVTWNDQDVFVSPTHTGDNVQNVSGYYDPCNNPADAWEIIMDDRISVIQEAGDPLSKAISGYYEPMSDPVECSHQHSDKNPLRAACIVYLMIKENEHV